MNADLQKLRDSRLFRRLPDRAFQRVQNYIKIRAFDSGDFIQDLKADRSMENYFGYVVQGRVLLMGSSDKPVGLACKDEFFLGRAFALGDLNVSRLFSAQDQTLVVYVRKEVFEVLASASEDFSDLIDDIYDAIYERAELISSDAKSEKAFQEWIGSPRTSRSLNTWLEQVEKKQTQAAKKEEKDRYEKHRVRILWAVAAGVMLALGLETYANLKQIPLSLSFFLTGEFPKFDPGSNYNIALGIIGYTLIIFTNIHTFSKWAIKKLKWKLDYKFSSQLHMLFGVLGAIFILFHAAFHISGGNIAHYALYAIFVATVSGMVGQIISAQIPKSIRGDKLRLDALQKEQVKLKQQAELLMSDNQYKTSVALMAQPLSTDFWGNVFGIHKLWFRRMKMRKTLKALGMGTESAGLASELLLKEFRIRQKIRGLELANQIFRRWMLIHKPFGYAVYILGALHILIVVFLT